MLGVRVPRELLETLTNLDSDSLSKLQTFQGASSRIDITMNQSTQPGSMALTIWSTFALISTAILTKVLQPRRTPLASFVRLKEACESMYLTWAYCLVLYACCMVLTLVVKTWQGTTVLVAATGITWSAMQFIPHTVIGVNLASHDDCDELYEYRGTILGLHNLVMSTPQIISALISSAVMQAMSGFGSVEPAAWSLRAASIPAMVSASLAMKASFGTTANKCANSYSRS